MFLVYMAVHSVEMETKTHIFDLHKSPERNNMKMSHRVMIQGILYSAALASKCLIFMLLVLIFSVMNYTYVTEILTSILLPLHGLWNALIYMKPLFRQIVKRRCKSRQKDNNNLPKASPWLKRLLLGSVWNPNRTSKESKSNINQQLEVQDESKDGKVLKGNDRVGVLKVNSKEEEQILHVNASSKLNRKVAMLEEIKGEEYNIATPSSLMMFTCVEEEEEAGESLSFPLPRNSELKREEEQSQLEHFFSALEIIADDCDDVDNEENDSDDESCYVDDYIRMMVIG